MGTEEGRWRRCGHPRTPENTSGRCCRACKTARQRERYATDPAFAEAERARARERYARNPEAKRAQIRAHYDALEGVAYNKRLLQMRRAGAMYRRRQREMEVS